MNRDVKVDVVFDWRRKASADRVGAVSVRVYYSRTDRRYVNTGVSVLPSQWSDKMWVVRHEDAVALNDVIRRQYEKCVEECRHADGDDVAVVSMKVDADGHGFLDWLEAAIMRQKLADGTRKHHRSMFRCLCEYGKIRRWDQVTRRNLLLWLEWVGRRKVMKPIGGEMVETAVEQSTVHGHWKRMRKYLNLAVSDGLLSSSVFSGIHVDVGGTKEREFLTDEEIRTVCDTQLTTECLRMARDRFVVQMCTGLSYADMLATDFSRREEVGGRVVVSGTRQKTGERFFLVVLPECLPILERWGWKVPPISNVDYNKFLGRVAIECGIQKHITSHVGRHTYACRCLRNGVRIEAVQRTLGHSKISTTQIYARMMDMDVVNAFNCSGL